MYQNRLDKKKDAKAPSMYRKTKQAGSCLMQGRFTDSNFSLCIDKNIGFSTNGEGKNKILDPKGKPLVENPIQCNK